MFSDVLTVERLGNEKNIAMVCVNKNADLFNEHFVGNPILPGAFSIVVCLQLISQSISETVQQQLMVKEIIKINFLKPIRPNDQLFIRIKRAQHLDGDMIVSFDVLSSESVIFVDGLIKLRRTQ